MQARSQRKPRNRDRCTTKLVSLTKEHATRTGRWEAETALRGSEARIVEKDRGLLTAQRKQAAGSGPHVGGQFEDELRRSAPRGQGRGGSRPDLREPIRLLARRNLAELPNRAQHVARIGANQEPIVACSLTSYPPGCGTPLIPRILSRERSAFQNPPKPPEKTEWNPEVSNSTTPT